MTTIKVAQISRAGGDFELVERPLPQPGPGQARIKVEACGICHSDAFVKEGGFPGLVYPRVPGHEVIGRIDALGEHVQGWQVGERAGVGWHGGHCGYCESCRRGDFITCAHEQVAGISYDGGYAEYMIAPVEALVRIPAALESAAAAPLLCAGITTYNALRHSGARAGDLVAVQGIGGLGHLGLQYAARMGFRVIAISNGADKRELAQSLGAWRYLDAKAEDPVQALQALGGARVILATAPNAKLMSSIIDGLGVDGELLVVGATADAITVSPLQLIMQRRRIQGWPSGTAKDSEDALNFSELAGVRAQIETYPLAQVNEAYARMISNQARFRVVLTMGQ